MSIEAWNAMTECQRMAWMESAFDLIPHTLEV